MNIILEEILEFETTNEDHIHLHHCSKERLWKAYDRSVLNLIELIPKLKIGPEEECFTNHEIRLYCVRINEGHMEHHNLPFHCTLLGDDYIKSQKRPVPE